MQNRYRMDENACVEKLLEQIHFSEAQLERIVQKASQWIEQVRATRLQHKGIDAFLQTYQLSTEEGVALMSLAESLLRIPDTATVERLLKDKLSQKAWSRHMGVSHSWIVNAATWSLVLCGKIINIDGLDKLLLRLSSPVIKAAMQFLGRQFVMAENITAALERANEAENTRYRYSFDMLGEAAKTAQDAEGYYQAYWQAIEAVGKTSGGLGPILGHGISVKLSALHPRYEWVQRERVFKEMLPKLQQLALLAKTHNVALTIDAEEAERLELSLLLIDALLADEHLADWQGLGVAVQAYQKRAPAVIDRLIENARFHKRRIMIRLVKGAYWDSEIKSTQEKGLKGYPVFTRKVATDVCYLVCAQKLFTALETVYPQFATHNANTVASILEMAGDKTQFEFQCLHGMGDTLYEQIIVGDRPSIRCRVYAPVGGYDTLLPYLVRRLLENGANSSFVYSILDESIPISKLVRDPITELKNILPKPHPHIPLPYYLFGEQRLNSQGIDITNTLETDPLIADLQRFSMENIVSPDFLEPHLVHTKPSELLERTSYLLKMAELLEQNRGTLLGLLVQEAGKTIVDALSEIREAVDFCRYYAHRATIDLNTQLLPGPVGEENRLLLVPRGIIACISPWNFPLAIFLGQVVAALAVGNTVIAKPASHTPRIAAFAVQLLHEAGFDKQAVQLCMMGGGAFSKQILSHPNIAGVMFTGSTTTAHDIAQLLAQRSGSLIPFIAETGGQNAMIVDSSALPEQVVSDVIASAFNSAGQRCSALRVLFLQTEIADRVLHMLKGAMAELCIGDPGDLKTDIGPVIDEAAKQNLWSHVEKMSTLGKLSYECHLSNSAQKGAFFAPRVYEIENLSVLTEEVFGPILHVIRFESYNLESVLQAINNTGYGLTLGIHSRIQDTIDYITEKANVGNIYVNRNMIGAVVGVQPFGGHGLSGTGPKAGGPHMLPRLCLEKTVSHNTTAIGGNVALVTGLV